MKKIWLLAMCCSIVFAENSLSIDIIDNSEEEQVIPATVAPETISQDAFMSASPLSTPATPSNPILPFQEVELITDASVPYSTEELRSSSLEIPSPQLAQKLTIDPADDLASLQKEEQEVAQEVNSRGIVIDLGQVFAGSPTIYTVLFLLSIASVGICTYALLSLRTGAIMPNEPFQQLQHLLQTQQFDLAMEACRQYRSPFFGMVETAIKNRHTGSSTMLEMMKSEGRRLTLAYWQKINLLNDIAIIAPMLGLLGTVLGMFYAFYDLNRSAESISALFDGLGVSVGTTVSGLVVAILALMFHAMTKYRLTQQLSLVEAKAESLASNIKDNT